ncbi:ApeA N-terminal domain 1-containing protein [Streptomyces sp. SAS_270]|uniref:ApeA N-terminal domain 1-containing protein n=1 Tax=Streptomyces sp. SAS_270 TaxID=3412748 RepID=UPI00403D3E0E
MSEEHHGAWWTPDTPGVRVPGSLTRAADGWRLNLIGTLMVNSCGWDGLYLVPPHTIWGSCQGVSYTLLDCYLDDEVQGPSPSATHTTSDQWTMGWRVGQLVHGGEITESTRFSAAEFEITGLPAWWPPSGLRGPRAGSGAYAAPDDVAIALDDGTIAISVRESRHHGRRMRSLRERVVVRADRVTGFTLDEVEKEIVAPRALVAIGVDEPVSVFNLRVVPKDRLPENRLPLFFTVDPHDGEAPEEPSPSLRAPMPLSPSLDAMPSFIPVWLKLARRCSVPLDAVEPRQRSGSLQLQLLDVVNAAETLHRALHDDPTEHPFAQRVRYALKDSGAFKSAERRDVYDAVKVFVDITLEKRLLALAEELGPKVGEWLFNDTVRPWAFVAAQIRNALSHGFPAPHRVHEDPGALAGALYLTEAVITLRLLIEAACPQTRPWPRSSTGIPECVPWPSRASPTGPHSPTASNRTSGSNPHPHPHQPTTPPHQNVRMRRHGPHRMTLNCQPRRRELGAQAGVQGEAGALPRDSHALPKGIRWGGRARCPAV